MDRAGLGGGFWEEGLTGKRSGSRQRRDASGQGAIDLSQGIIQQRPRGESEEVTEAGPVDKPQVWGPDFIH